MTAFVGGKIWWWTWVKASVMGFNCEEAATRSKVSDVREEKKKMGKWEDRGEEKWEPWSLQNKQQLQAVYIVYRVAAALYSPSPCSYCRSMVVVCFGLAAVVHRCLMHYYYIMALLSSNTGAPFFLFLRLFLMADVVVFAPKETLKEEGGSFLSIHLQDPVQHYATYSYPPKNFMN